MKNKFMKKKNTRPANKKIAGTDLKNKIVWSKFKEQAMGYYAKNPVIFIGSAAITVLVSLLIISPEDPMDSDSAALLASSQPITLSIPSEDKPSLSETVKPLVLVETRSTKIDSFDAPLAEEDIIRAEMDEDMLDDSDIMSIKPVKMASMEIDSPNHRIEGRIENNQSSFTINVPKKENVIKPARSTIVKPVDSPSIQPIRSTAAKPIKRTHKKAVDSWVFKKRGDQYTIQLIGGANKKDILKFIKANRDVKRLSYYHTIKKGKSWYVVVKSTYNSFAGANKIRKTLPARFRKHKPWVRKYASIQKEISANAEKIILLTNSFAGTD